MPSRALRLSELAIASIGLPTSSGTCLAMIAVLSGSARISPIGAGRSAEAYVLERSGNW